VISNNSATWQVVYLDRPSTVQVQFQLSRPVSTAHGRRPRLYFWPRSPQRRFGALADRRAHLNAADNLSLLASVSGQHRRACVRGAVTHSIGFAR
jgi:hypothetical protein